jgi:hypothetical protein
VVSNAPDAVDYGGTITVKISNFADNKVEMVSWMRIGSTTHSTNMSQSRRVLNFETAITDGKLNIFAPESKFDCPPGHYMLFVLDNKGVPAIAPIIRLNSASKDSPAAVTNRLAARVAAAPLPEITIQSLDEEMAKQKDQPYVVVGLTTSCPYGLGPCWGGANEALHQISDIEAVRPQPNQEDAVAYVYLKQDMIPDIDSWREQFASFVNGTYFMRGIEMLLSGTIKRTGGYGAEHLALTGNSTRPDLPLAQLKAASKVQRDRLAHATRPMTDIEAGAFDGLIKAIAERPDATVKVTGPLIKRDGQYSLEVREFEVA